MRGFRNWMRYGMSLNLSIIGETLYWSLMNVRNALLMWIKRRTSSLLIDQVTGGTLALFQTATWCLLHHITVRNPLISSFPIRYVIGDFGWPKKSILLYNIQLFRFSVADRSDSCRFGTEVSPLRCWERQTVRLRQRLEKGDQLNQEKGPAKYISCILLHAALGEFPTGTLMKTDRHNNKARANIITKGLSQDFVACTR